MRGPVAPVYVPFLVGARQIRAPTRNVVSEGQSRAEPQRRSGEPMNTEQAQEPASYLLLRLGSEIYAVPGVSVRGIARWRALTPVPGAPAGLPGIINQRGFVMPVVNIHPLLGLPESPPDRATRYVLIQHDDVDLALLVDSVLDLVELSPTTFEALPVGLDPQRARFLSSIAHLDDQMLALLDLSAVIAALRAGD